MRQGGKVIYKNLSYLIVGILFEVYNNLGYGYQEKYYERAIEQCLIESKINYKRQASYKLTFKGKDIGRYYMDFIIDSRIVLEIKVGTYFSKQNINQVRGYIKATGYKLGILASFRTDGLKFMRILNPDNLNN